MRFFYPCLSDVIKPLGNDLGSIFERKGAQEDHEQLDVGHTEKDSATHDPQ